MSSVELKKVVYNDLRLIIPAMALSDVHTGL